MKKKVFVKKTENFVTILNSHNSYERKYVSPDLLILLKRSYCKAKSFPPNESSYLILLTIQSHPTLQSSIK